MSACVNYRKMEYAMAGARKRKSYGKAKVYKRAYKKAYRAVPAARMRASLAESKAVDVQMNMAINNVAASNILLLNGMTLGTNAYNRQGRKVTGKYLRIRGHIQQAQAATATTTNDLLTIAVVYDRQPNGVAPTFADVFTDVDNAGTASVSSLASGNLNNADRFKVLLRDQFHMSSTGAAATFAPSAANTDYRSFFIDRFIKLKGLETHFSSASNAGTIADITTGSIYMLVRGNQIAADSPYAWVATSRFRYNDA